MSTLLKTIVHIRRGMSYSCFHVCGMTFLITDFSFLCNFMLLSKQIFVASGIEVCHKVSPNVTML